MLGLLILIAALSVGFAIGYGTREFISRKRRAEYRVYARYFQAPPPSIKDGWDAGVVGRAKQQPNASVMMRAVSYVAASVSIALALDFALELLAILLLPNPG